MDNTPQRMCVACRNRNEKRNLVRIVRSANGKAFIDDTKKANGRGAYICLDMTCIGKSKKSNALGRALKCEIDSEIYSELEKRCNGNG